ncbi:hypothetical protein [Maritimibacter alexandrii]|uniref:hypothetical protein n=1 Tax=Maritimibacter alexandrii TaxID=2570355 RepID=UPI001109CACE|nr:hypothetical protein [Maritimibacter alexandrii]
MADNRIVAKSDSDPRPAELKLVRRVGDELKNASQDCGRLQVLVSSLLDKTDHPDLVGEFHMLQDLDRLHQVLADLACLLNEIGRNSQALTPDHTALANLLKLASLRHRLFPELANTDLSDEDEVTFF